NHPQSGSINVLHPSVELTVQTRLSDFIVIYLRNLQCRFEQMHFYLEKLANKTNPARNSDYKF
ncbi:hypothetical protein, partial [Raoultella sp. T31]|uniref:hypothetical protein n=1 Tax=Raoultella sp. T31 TaxID=2054594 RepID=UPI00197F49C5